MEDTESEQKAELYNVILKNLYHHDPVEPLPSRPWFLKTENSAQIILKDLLVQSKNSHETFAKNAAKALLECKAKSIDDKMCHASLLLESIDISKAMTLVRKSADSSANSLDIVVEKSQSTQGPVSVVIQINNLTKTLEEGDKGSYAVSLSGNIDFIFLADDGIVEIDRANLLVRDIITSTYYLSGMQKGVIQSGLNRKGNGYEIVIRLQLTISRNDRLEILEEKHEVTERVLLRQQEEEDVYKDLLTSLCVEDIEDRGFKSLIQQENHDRYCGCMMIEDEDNSPRNGWSFSKFISFLCCCGCCRKRQTKIR